MAAPVLGGLRRPGLLPSIQDALSTSPFGYHGCGMGNVMGGSMTVRSFDTDPGNTVVLPSGQRVHRDHLAQNEVIRAQFESPRDGVWTVIGNGLSNQTFIRAPAGIIAIDTGESIEEMAAALRQLREATEAPIAAVLYTHFHYVEGTRAILQEGNCVEPLPVYGHPRIAANKARAGGEIGPAYGRGLVEQFALALPADGPDGNLNVGLGFWYRNPAHAPFTPGFLAVTHPLTGSGSVQIAGLRVEFTQAPSDSDDSINFWFPEIGTCVHNSVWPALFNVFPIRGEEYRDPRVLIPGIDQIIAWGPEYLVGAHGPAIVGKAEIRAKATRYRDSIQFLWDQTVRGINKGWTSDELAARVRLPALYDQDYLTAERYGVAEHHVRQIHAGLRGWFDGDESKLFPLEPAERYARLMDGFGGREAVRSKAGAALDADDLRWGIELATWLVRSPGAERADRDLLARGLRLVAERTPAANIRSWALTRARHLDGSTPIDRYFQHRFNPRLLGDVDSAALVATLRVLVDPAKIEGIDHHVAFRVDTDTCGLHVRNGVVVPTDGAGAQSEIRISRETLLGLLSGKASWSQAQTTGELSVHGDGAAVERVRSAFDLEGLRS